MPIKRWPFRVVAEDRRFKIRELSRLLVPVVLDQFSVIRHDIRVVKTRLLTWNCNIPIGFGVASTLVHFYEGLISVTPTLCVLVKFPASAAVTPWSGSHRRKRIHQELFASLLERLVSSKYRPSLPLRLLSSVPQRVDQMPVCRIYGETNNIDCSENSAE